MTLSSCYLSHYVLVFLLVSVLYPIRTTATDYILTLGGGYNPAGNQASLEANVLFFQQVLQEVHLGARNSTVYFADGDNSQADLQVVDSIAPPAGPLTDLLTRLHSRGGPEVTYRNHEVTDVAGPLTPQLIERSVRNCAGEMTSGDRLIVYVTAHGEQARGKNKFNTFISCWENQRFSAREFSNWLDDIPQEVPVILVMAQCYCGGFAHAIFNQGDIEQGLSARIRCGFFAQQHDLPAAGCRPDIDNDEEYSSFFWGAFAGQSRNGKPLVNVDCNKDGKVSFAEAHAQAVIVSQTIDIPLRTSEVLLRQYSRIDGYEHRGMPTGEEIDVFEANEDHETEPALEAPSCLQMSGSIQSIVDLATPDVGCIIKELSGQLGIELDSDVTAVFEAYTQQQVEFRDARIAVRDRRGRGTGRRELREFRDALQAEWPSLADRNAWRESEFLMTAKQADLFEQIKELPGYASVDKYFEQRERNSKRVEAAELRDVKFQRLINTLEIAVLARNLAVVASPDIVQRYRAVLAVEDTPLNPE